MSSSPLRRRKPSRRGRTCCAAVLIMATTTHLDLLRTRIQRIYKPPRSCLLARALYTDQRDIFRYLPLPPIMLNRRHLSARRLAAYLLLCNGSEVVARPNPQDPTGSGAETITPVTSAATVDGKPVTATYTPTSISITGLAPPITAATTVTTTDSAGATVAIAIAAGAGVVAGGALAGWLFKPVAGAPPAPTTPPAYTTSAQNNEPPSTTKETEPATTSTPPTCPFPTQGSSLSFGSVAKQPAWTAEIPSQTGSSYAPQCTPSGSNGQLFRGVDPGFIKELSAVFCKNDQSKDASQTIDKDDLPDGSSWKRDSGPTEKVKFTFDLKNKVDGCASHCQDAYSHLILGCKSLE